MLECPNFYCVWWNGWVTLNATAVAIKTNRFSLAAPLSSADWPGKKSVL